MSDLSENPTPLHQGVQEVQIINIDVPFGRLIWLLIKVAIAAVPAGIIVLIFWSILSAVIFGVFGALPS